MLDEEEIEPDEDTEQDENVEKPDSFRLHAPLFFAALFFVAGIFVAQKLYLHPGPVLAGVCALALVTFLSACFARRIAWMPLFLLWVFLGVWSAETAPQPAPSQPIRALNDGLLRAVDGTVEPISQMSE